MAGAKNRAKCGTTSGYVSHYYHGEKPCPECRAANREYQRQRRQNKRQETP